MATAGNMFGGTASVAATSGTYDIRPGAGVEWVIHNVYNNSAGTSASTVNLAMTDGTNVVQFDSLSAGDARMGMTTHVSNTYWLRVTNTTGTAALIAYDGMQTA